MEMDMNILLCGASGFLGRNIAQGLVAAGHRVVCGHRNPRRCRDQDIHVDFKTDTKPEIWMPRLKDIDVVINAVGVLRDTARQPMQKIHSDTPRALFRACELAKIKCVVQISALDVGSSLLTPFTCTKGEADFYLGTLNLRSHIIRPAFVYGNDGLATKVFRFLASMPFIPVPGNGESKVQPVYIGDIVELVVNLLDNVRNPHFKAPVINAVGAQVMTYRQMLLCYRAQLTSLPALVLPVSWRSMHRVAKVARKLPFGILDPDSLRILHTGSTASVHDFAQVLRREPKKPHTFVTHGLNFHMPAHRHV